jgi:hypothetical protein
MPILQFTYVEDGDLPPLQSYLTQPGEGASPQSVWSPAMYPNLALWLRGDGGTTIATGVSQWNDLSGNGSNVVQATGSKQPAFNSTGGPNGQAYLNFVSASAQYLSIALAVLGVSPWTVFAIVSSTTPSVEGFFLDVGSSGNGAAFGLDGVSTDRTLWYPGAAVLGSTAMSASTWEGWCAQNNGTTSSLLINGVAQSLTNATTQPLTPTALTQIGAGIGTGANNWNGGIAEIIVYSSVLTAAQIVQVRSYLQARYGGIG